MRNAAYGDTWADVHATTTVTMVRSMAYLPGWRATALNTTTGSSMALSVTRHGLIQQVTVPEGDWQVVMTAFLGLVGGGEIDHQTFGRQGEAQTGEGGAYAFAAFGHGLVAQADNDEIHLARGDLHLDIDAPRLHAFKGRRHDPRRQGQIS